MVKNVYFPQNPCCGSASSLVGVSFELSDVAFLCSFAECLILSFVCCKRLCKRRTALVTHTKSGFGESMRLFSHWARLRPSPQPGCTNLSPLSQCDSSGRDDNCFFSEMKDFFWSRHNSTTVAVCSDPQEVCALTVPLSSSCLGGF